MSAPEWKRALLGCLGAACYGTIHPIQAYCMGTIISVYFINDKSVIDQITNHTLLLHLLNPSSSQLHCQSLTTLQFRNYGRKFNEEGARKDAWEIANL